MANATDDEYHEFIASLNPANQTGGHGGMTTGNASDATSHTMSHLGPQEWKPMTDQADCDAVAAELAQAKAVSEKYPTAADAMAAGYVRVAPYVPGIASHWMKFSLVDGTFDIDEPEMLLFDGNGETAHIVGLSYYVVMPGDDASRRRASPATTTSTTATSACAAARPAASSATPPPPTRSARRSAAARPTAAPAG